jgi:hypothetical protein
VDTYNVLYFVCVVVELAGYRGVSDSRFDCCCSEFCHVTCFCRNDILRVSRGNLQFRYCSHWSEASVRIMSREYLTVGTIFSVIM